MGFGTVNPTFVGRLRNYGKVQTEQNLVPANSPLMFDGTAPLRDVPGFGLLY